MVAMGSVIVGRWRWAAAEGTGEPEVKPVLPSRLLRAAAATADPERSEGITPWSREAQPEVVLEPAQEELGTTSGVVAAAAMVAVAAATRAAEQEAEAPALPEASSPYRPTAAR
jgi:hypothetical protein